MILKGLIGWSNKRTGLEFYRYDEKIIPRHESEWGDLLTYELTKSYEGCPVLVVILDRALTPQEVDEMKNGIAGQIEMYN